MNTLRLIVAMLIIPIATPVLNRVSAADVSAEQTDLEARYGFFSLVTLVAQDVDRQPGGLSTSRGVLTHFGIDEADYGILVRVAREALRAVRATPIPHSIDEAGTQTVKIPSVSQQRMAAIQAGYTSLFANLSPPGQRAVSEDIAKFKSQMIGSLLTRGQ